MWFWSWVKPLARLVFPQSRARGLCQRLTTSQTSQVVSFQTAMRVAVRCQRPIWQIVLRLAASIVTALLTTMGPALAQETTTTSVSSVSDLKRAVADQVQHIVVNSHLDLSKESAASGASERWILQLKDVESLRVCSFSVS